MDDWWKEFESPTIPYANEFVSRVKRKEKLKQINNSYQSASPSKTIKVKFDDIKIVFYYIP